MAFLAYLGEAGSPFLERLAAQVEVGTSLELQEVPEGVAGTSQGLLADLVAAEGTFLGRLADPVGAVGTCRELQVALVEVEGTCPAPLGGLVALEASYQAVEAAIPFLVVVEVPCLAVEAAYPLAEVEDCLVEQEAQVEEADRPLEVVAANLEEAEAIPLVAGASCQVEEAACP